MIREIYSLSPEKFSLPRQARAASRIHMVEPSLKTTGQFLSEDSRPTQPSRARLHYAALLETTQALTRIQDYHEFLQLVLEKMLDVSGADTVRVLLLDEGKLQFIGGRDPRRGALSSDASPLPQVVIDRVSSTHEAVCVRDVSRDIDLHTDPGLAAKYISALLVLPMYRGDALFGVVYLDCHSVLVWLDDLDVSILKGMTTQLALYTDNAINMSEIARLNENIESEVQDRTESLVQANEFLARQLADAEKQLVEKEHEEQKRARFFAALAHEFRSPMQLVLGHAHMILAEGEEKFSPDQRRSMDVIMKTSQHIRDLVTKVMDANKLEEGEMTISPAPFDLRPLIDEVVDMGRGLLEDKPTVQINKYYAPDLFPMVVGDPTRIRQVMLNLVSNACRFTDKGKITVSAMEHDSYVVISVVDTGAGIAPDKLNSIFEPYKQADALRAHTGAGLGLSISKQLVELHGGKIIVKSTVGTGSIFAFNLPIAM
jgi:signal transduction histidine kinase